MSDIPPIREAANGIEIDVKKNHWPFVRFMRDDDGGIIIVVDQNLSGPIVGEGTGVAAVRIGPKKARRVREFLERTEDS